MAENKRRRYIAFSIVTAVYIANAVCELLFRGGNMAGFYQTCIICFLVSIYYVNYADSMVVSDIISSSVLFISICYFTLQGDLLGYDILWVLIVPVLWLFVVDYRIAFIVNTLFFIFFMAVFYSPLNVIFEGIYDRSFMLRFPFALLIILAISGIFFLENRRSRVEAKIRTYNDELTGLSNRAYYTQVVNFIRKKGLANINMIVVSLDVNSLKTINDTFGHESGDILIKAAADVIRRAFVNADMISRIGGDEFVVITYEDETSFFESYNRIDEYCKEFKNDKIGELSISKGYARSRDYLYINPEKLYIIADRDMYVNKSKYYQSNHIDRRNNPDRRNNTDRRSNTDQRKS